MKIDNKVMESPSDGMHTAILYAIYDLGTQKLEFVKGEVQYKHRIQFNWELADEKMADLKPFVVSKEYTLVGGPKASLTIDIQSWLSQAPDRNFKFESLLGKACNLNIQVSEKGWPKIVGTPMPLKKSEVIPPQFNASHMFDLDNFSIESFERVPEWIRKKIAASPEYIEAVNKMNGVPEKPKPKVSNDLNDEVPW